MCRRMARNLANHNTIHRLQTNIRDGKPIQQAKPQIGQATKRETNQDKKTALIRPRWKEVAVPAS